MSRTLVLSVAVPVVLDGTGGGTAQAGPASPGETWLPQVVSVGAAESAVLAEAQCKIYAGESASQPNFVDGTLSGSTGDSTSNVAGQVLYPGQYLWAVWTGGDAGVTAVMNVTGTRTVP